MNDSDARFDFIAAKIHNSIADHARLLNEQLFRSGERAQVPPLGRIARLRVMAARMRAYSHTLWRAIRGDDPYDTDYDY